MVRIIGRFEKSGIKLRCLTGEWICCGSSYREVRETEGSKNRDSMVINTNNVQEYVH